MRPHLTLTHLHEAPDIEKRVWIRAYCTALGGYRACKETYASYNDDVRTWCINDANEALVAFQEKFYESEMDSVPDKNSEELPAPDISTDPSPRITHGGEK